MRGTRSHSENSVPFGHSRAVTRRRAVLLALLLASGCQQSSADRSAGPAGTSTKAPLAAPIPLQETPPAGLTGTIAFQSDRAGRSKLFTLDLATQAVTALTTGGGHHDEEPAWSPDGARLAFSTTRFDARTYDVAVMEVATGDVERVTDHVAFERHPAWTADGRGLLFSSEQDGTQAVFRIASGSRSVARVSPAPERALMPAASPDGRRLAFTMGTPEGLQTWLLDAESGRLQQVTHASEGAARPRWSPDGTWIAYTRLVPGGSCVEILDIATGHTHRIGVDGLATLTEPAWSPDGQWLIASGSATGSGEENWDLILLQPRSPARAIRLTRGPGNDRAAAWKGR
jgi:TolB protein